MKGVDLWRMTDLSKESKHNLGIGILRGTKEPAITLLQITKGKLRAEIDPTMSYRPDPLFHILVRSGFMGAEVDCGRLQGWISNHSVRLYCHLKETRKTV